MKKRERKLVIVIWNLGLGGIQKRMRDLTIAIEKNHPQWQVYFLVKERTESHFLDSIQEQTSAELKFFSDAFSTPRNLPFVIWVAIQYLKINPEVCLTFLDHLSVSLAIIKTCFFWTKTKLVLNEGVLTSSYLPLNKRKPYWRHLISFFYPLADQIIVPTKQVKQDLINNFSIPAHKIMIIANWTLLPPIKEKRGEEYDLIYIGRFKEEKNPLGMVSLVAELKKKLSHISALMLGSGSQLEDVVTKIAQLELHHNLSLMGICSNPDHFLEQSRILVLPTKNEGLPNVVLEAGMKQVPTVSSSFLGAKEVIIDDQTGYICQSPSEMIEKIEYLLNHPQKIDEMGQAAQNHVQNNFHEPQQQEFIETLLTRG